MVNKKQYCWIIFLLVFIQISCNQKNDIYRKSESTIKFDESNLIDEKNQSDKYLDKEFMEGYTTNQIIWKSNTADLNGDGIIDTIKVVSLDNRIFSKSENDEHGDFKAMVFINNLCIDFIFNWTMNSYFFKKGTKFEIIDIDKNDKYKEVLISQNQQEMEDPSIQRTIFRYFGSNLLTKTKILSEGYSAGQMNLKNNEFSIDHHRSPDIIGTYQLSNFFIKNTGLIEKKLPENFIQAACPFVYVKNKTTFIKQGEILRFLNAKNTEDWQFLELKDFELEKDVLTIKLTEEKDEVTFLNSIKLKIGKTEVFPMDSIDFNKSFLKDDKEYFQLNKNDFLILKFKLPKNKQGKILLFAKGYYVPR